MSQTNTLAKHLFFSCVCRPSLAECCEVVYKQILSVPFIHYSYARECVCVQGKQGVLSNHSCLCVANVRLFYTTNAPIVKIPVRLITALSCERDYAGRSFDSTADSRSFGKTKRKTSLIIRTGGSYTYGNYYYKMVMWLFCIPTQS